MKKIKKVDPKAAQSVFSFACPCVGTCYSCLGICGCPIQDDGIYYSIRNSTSATISLLGQYGTQTVNYN